jgi:enamine deaminase RidA (YjgF/YER057c/UK114 family)
MSAPHEIVNPWTWQDQFGYAQAVVAAVPSRWLFVAGQGPADAHGDVMHEGDIAGQLNQAFDNLETVLDQAGADLSHVVRLNYFTTDVDGLLAVWNMVTERLARTGSRPSSTLLGVARLAFPNMLIELEATALVP